MSQVCQSGAAKTAECFSAAAFIGKHTPINFIVREKQRD
jgi:hypothetical protein